MHTRIQKTRRLKNGVTDYDINTTNLGMCTCNPCLDDVLWKHFVLRREPYIFEQHVNPEEVVLWG